MIDNLFANGQVATRYVDLNGVPTMDEDYNPNGSYAAIEGVSRALMDECLEKMAHSERIGDSVAINIVETRTSISLNQVCHTLSRGILP